MSTLNKIKRNLSTPNEWHYLKYRNIKINRRTILLEAVHGREISGHIYALVKELLTSYPNYQVFIAVNKSAFIPEDFKKNTVLHMSKDYLKLLATCEILINDTSFWSFFHKRSEQKYYIFWHGTPLKQLGKSTQIQGYGNVQRNLAAADQVFVSNEFTRERLVKDFGIESIVDNQFVIGPSPRNSALFVNKVIRGRYLYMPTWRGTDVAKVQIRKNFYEFLKELDVGLKDTEELYIKLHPYEEALLNFKEEDYKHIKLFPKNEDVYLFLQTVEQLITDYSSIMFDFYLTRRPIVLFTYDKADYLRERGIYFDMDDLAFPQCQTVREVLNCLHSKRQNIDQNLLESFVEFDSINGTKIVLDYLLKNIENQSIQVIPNWNEKENILIYAYQLADNGITASLLNLFDQVDLTKRNYILTWQEGMIPQDLEYKVKNLPEGVYTFIQTNKVQSTMSETIPTAMYMAGIPLKTKKMEKMYQRDFQRNYLNVPISHFVHYPGYDRSYCVWTWALKPLGIKTFIFVHTDMKQEFQVNRQLKPRIIYEAYQKADKVVCVTNSIEKKVQEVVPDSDTAVMNVLFNEEKIREMALTDAISNVPSNLQKAFDDEEITVFISVGRFSKQKGYDRLVKAFEKLDNPFTRLVLICSYGPEREMINQQIKESHLKEQIFLLEKFENPYCLVNKADAFVFSSRYEGLGMVVFESLAVNTPVIMTRIPETLEVLGDEELAIVVNNSTEGIYTGLKSFIDGKRPKSFFDFEQQRMNSLNIWESFFEK
ncbi:CDP-glycerol glycerophosphotransferase family protein [Enterococcus eurekensis]|uniref:CDP-glycerol glycerophosphotransferase family protein n=2 Tax=Enterococcus TaxID=1350 RepID=A0ABV9M4L3_9ENTE